MRVAYVDAQAGIAGDMLLGALVDCGLPTTFLQGVADRLALGDLKVEVRDVMRGPIAAKKVDVLLGGKPISGAEDTHAATGHGHHRHLADIREILGRLGDPTTGPLRRACHAFELLAEAEAQVHGTTPEHVHFHEVGAADALLDIAGTCLGLAELGVEEVRVSPLPLGSGTIRAAHGAMPNPAPATFHLLKGLALVPSTETFEQVTPTGAALLRALATQVDTGTPLTPDVIGHGAGTHPGGALPNIVRLVLGARHPEGTSGHASEREVALLLETNLDDVTPQVVSHAMACVMQAGALDAWTTAATMKKGRPGVVLHVLCDPAAAARLGDVLFRETPTLGIRHSVMQRRVLPRAFETVTTPYGEVRMKVRLRPDGRAATPEYEDCAACAREHDVAIDTVMQAARQAWHAREQQGPQDD
jgi:uncharacterized protein (TIGR00299 family) protein